MKEHGPCRAENTLGVVMFQQSKSGSFTKHRNEFSGSARGDGLDQASARAIANYNTVMGMDRRMVVSEFSQGRGMSFGPSPEMSFHDREVLRQGGSTTERVLWTCSSLECAINGVRLRLGNVTWDLGKPHRSNNRHRKKKHTPYWRGSGVC
jgi:hypothetical protein